MKKEIKQKQQEIKKRAQENLNKIPMPCGFENKLGILKKYSRVDYISKLKTIDMNMTSDDKFYHILNFKDFKGFKKVINIKMRYKIGRVIGEGSFGQVRIALHR